MGILRVIGATIYAPLLAGILLLFLMTGWFALKFGPLTALLMIPTMIAYGVNGVIVLGYTAMLILVLPYYFISLKCKALSTYWGYALVGGISAYMTLYLLGESDPPFVDGLFLAGGIFTGLIFFRAIAKPQKFKNQESVSHAQTH